MSSCNQKIFSRLKRGVTLVELLIVIAIIGILATLVTFAINPGKRMGQARDSTRKAALSQVSRALVAYYLDRQTYPNPGADLFSDSTEGDDWIPGLKPDYLKNLPKDPKQASMINGLASTHRQNKGQVLGMVTDNTGFYTQASTSVSDDLVAGAWVSTVDWKDLETAQGSYNWNALDSNSLLNSATSLGKRVRLKVGGGVGAPAWLVGNTVPTAPGLCAQDSPIPQYYILTGSTGDYCAPYVWDTRYVSAYESFIKALVQHVNNASYNNNVAMISVTDGPLFAEMITPGGQAAYTDAQSLPIPTDPDDKTYTREGYANAWKTAIDAAVSAGGTIPLNINLSQTWDQTQASPWQFNDWVAKNVGDYVNSKGYSSVEFSNDSVPGTFASLIPYFQSQLAGRAISVQIGWNKLQSGSFEGEANGVVTYNELCSAYKSAYDLGARAIEVNKKAFTTDPDPTLSLRPATEKWDLALKKGSGPEPTDCAGSPAATPTPGPTPEPGITPAPTATPAPGPEGDFKYRYYSSGLQTFELWAILEDKEDKETYPNPLAGRTCKLDPPSGTSYNYCVAY